MTYSFGPLERRGLLGPVRAGQAAVIAMGGVTGIAALDASPSALGVLLAGALLAAALAASCVPVGGRTAEEWLPLTLAFSWRRIRRRRFASGGMTVGTRVGRRGLLGHAPVPVAPPQLRDVRLVAADYHGRPLGAVSERSGRRLTSVLACRVVAFSLLDQEAQERRLARWGLVLSGAGGSAIRRVQWIERTAPAQGDELVRWVHTERDPAVPLRGTPMIDSYLELISSTARVTQEHEILLAIQVDAQRVRDRGADSAIRALLEQTERVAQGLEAAEVTVLGALSPGQLARALRTAFDPYARSELTALDACDPERDGLDEVNAWPLGTRENWEHYQSDGALHATYWIGAWPRVEVSPMFMDSLLGHSGVVRSVSVTFEPLAGDRSTREVEAAITRDRADQELRARFGQSETARQRQAAAATRRRETELAAGHSEVRLSGFVTVTGRDADDLRRACAEVSEQAARARLELHRLYGQQADAFTFTLPLCRGLR
jgi:Putative type VII ESX secretion system translocon, EccE